MLSLTCTLLSSYTERTVLSGCFGPKMTSDAISDNFIKKNFLGGHAPRLPYLLHAYTCNITHHPPPNLMYPVTQCKFVVVNL